MDSGCIIKGCSKSPVKMTHRISSLACFKNMCTASTSLLGEVNSSVQGSREVFRRSRLAQSYAASNFSVLFILLFERILKGVEIMLHVYFYTKTHCPLCEDAKALLLLLQHDYQFELEERDIYTNDAWLEAYQISIPVVEMNGKQLDATEISYSTLERALKKNT